LFCGFAAYLLKFGASCAHAFALKSIKTSHQYHGRNFVKS